MNKMGCFFKVKDMARGYIYDQNMTVAIISSELMICLQSNLVGRSS